MEQNPATPATPSAAMTRSSYMDQVDTQGRSLVPATMGDMMRIAEMIARAGICPKAFKDDPGSVLLVMAASQQLGVPWFAGLQRAHVIEGKVGFEAILLEAVAKMSPRCLKLYFKEVNDQRAIYVVQTTEMDAPVEVEYTIEMARKAGLLSRGGAWNTSPQDMLVARARKRAVTRYFPEAVMGVFAVEDLQDATLIRAETVVDKPPTNGSGSTLDRLAERSPEWTATALPAATTPRYTEILPATQVEEPAQAKRRPGRPAGTKKAEPAAQAAPSAPISPPVEAEVEGDLFGAPGPTQAVPAPDADDEDRKLRADALLKDARDMIGKHGMALVSAFIQTEFGMRDVQKLDTNQLDQLEDYVNEVVKSVRGS